MSSEETVPVVYADGVRVNVNPSTVTFLFSRVEGWTDPPTEHQLVRVQMSPIHFKLMLGVLPRILDEYERNFGEITVQGIDAGMQVDRPFGPDDEGS